MLTEILYDGQLWLKQIASLKLKALDYPLYYVEEQGGCIWVTTMVTFLYKGIEYKRHHVESVMPNKYVGQKEAILRLMQSARLTLYHGLPTKFDEPLTEPNK